MAEAGPASTGVLGVLVAAALAALAMIAANHITARRGSGFFQYFAYPILLSLAVLIFFSPRTFTVDVDMQSDLLSQRNPVSKVIGPLTSLFLVFASLNCIVSYVLRRGRSGTAPHALLLAYIVFWLTTIASPALLGAHGSFSHDYAYTLLMGCAALLLTEGDGDASVTHTRNASMVFLALSVVLIPLRPTLVLDRNYASGLLPGLPRLAGLASHSISLGMLAQIALLCLYAKPVARRSLNIMCWGLGLFTLFLVQSKTSWLSFPPSAACIFWARNSEASARSLRAPTWRRNSLVIALSLTSLLVVVGLSFILGDLGVTISSIFGQKGAALATLTGRDKIWAVALEDWARYPTFGYGSSLFDEQYRASIGMPFAAHGHNQFIDTLARSGLVGAAGLILYTFTLFAYSVRYARATLGLSLALFVAIAVRSVTEIPLSVFRYGAEVMQHLLLLSILAGAARSLSGLKGARSAPALEPSGSLRMIPTGEWPRQSLRDSPISAPSANGRFGLRCVFHRSNARQQR